MPLTQDWANRGRFVTDGTRRSALDANQLRARTIRDLARRVKGLDAETKRIRSQLHDLITEVAPDMLDPFGVGVDTAAELLVAAGDNPHRIRSEAAWAHLCGVAPVPASSGETVRHRLNRGGNRQANSVLYRIVISRLSGDARTKADVARRRAEGRTTKEIIRCLKRYVAREIYRHLPRDA